MNRICHRHLVQVSNNDGTLSFAWSLTAPVLDLGFALLQFNIFSDVFQCLVVPITPHPC